VSRNPRQALAPDGVTDDVCVQDLHTWYGTDAITQQQLMHQGAGKWYLLQQAGLVRQAPPDLMREQTEVPAPDGSRPRIRFMHHEMSLHTA
jgi:hypothetical protein